MKCKIYLSMQSCLSMWVNALSAFLYLKQYTVKILLSNYLTQSSQFITTVTEHIASMNCYMFSVFLWDKAVPFIPVIKKQEENLTSSSWLLTLRYIQLFRAFADILSWVSRTRATKLVTILKMFSLLNSKEKVCREVDKSRSPTVAWNCYGQEMVLSL